MRQKLCWQKGKYQVDMVSDEIIIEYDNLGELRAKARAEMEKRGWKEEDCWSEII